MIRDSRTLAPDLYEGPSPSPAAPGELLTLAPMEGVGDAVFRAVLTELGGIDYCVSEFVRVAATVPPAHVFLRHCPELLCGGRTPSGTPVHVQLLGGDPGRMGEAAAILATLEPPAIDLNFGCPAPTVNRHDGGASLLRAPARVEAVTSAVRRAVPARIPVSAKIRLGWDDPDAVVELARAAEAGGADWITVHGRTRVQGYAPPADWTRIGRARAAVAVPVVANGDVTSPAALERCRDETGCTRFMVGRAAIARPELFRLLRGLEPRWWPPLRRVRILLRFVDESLRRAPGRQDGILARLKQWGRAMAAGDPALFGMFEVLKRTQTLGAAGDALAAAVAD